MTTDHDGENGAPDRLRVRVGFADVDMMRVAHHSRYWVWCEEARFHFLRNVLAVTPAQVEAQAIYTPLSAASCSYLQPARWGDELEVEVRMEVGGGAKFTFHHQVLRIDAARTLLARATTTHVFTGLDLRLRLTVPPFYRDKLNAALQRTGDRFIDAPANPHVGQEER